MKLTQEEANTLIEMLKRAVREYSFKFPQQRGKIAFDVVGERRENVFTVNIDRKGINAYGCTYQGRVKSNNIILMRLDVNPTARHMNPSDGKIIEGTHLHVYTEEYDIREAMPFDVENVDLFDTCLLFFQKFNIVEPPQMLR